MVLISIDCTGRMVRGDNRKATKVRGNLKQHKLCVNNFNKIFSYTAKCAGVIALK